MVIGGVAYRGGAGHILRRAGGGAAHGVDGQPALLARRGQLTKEIVQGLVFIAVVGAQAYYLRKAGRDDGLTAASPACSIG